MESVLRRPPRPAIGLQQLVRAAQTVAVDAIDAHRHAAGEWGILWQPGVETRVGLDDPVRARPTEDDRYGRRLVLIVVLHPQMDVAVPTAGLAQLRILWAVQGFAEARPGEGVFAHGPSAFRTSATSSGTSQGPSPPRTAIGTGSLTMSFKRNA